MNRQTFQLLEGYMRACVRDHAHDENHVLRVLYNALEIAADEPEADLDVLIAACLLHDIARGEEMENPHIRHAAAGAEKARRFLLENGFAAEFAERVAACIALHSYGDAPRPLPEQRILYDADKLDSAGALGTARTLMFHGVLGDPLYCLSAEGEVQDGEAQGQGSYFAQYQGLLKKLPEGMLTPAGREMAAGCMEAARRFYESALLEARQTHQKGVERLNAALEK